MTSKLIIKNIKNFCADKSIREEYRTKKESFQVLCISFQHMQYIFEGNVERGRVWVSAEELCLPFGTLKDLNWVLG